MRERFCQLRRSDLVPEKEAPTHAFDFLGRESLVAREVKDLER